MRDLGPNAELIGQKGGAAALFTPALVLDLDALEANIAEMAAFCADKGVALRPHAKTHKSVAIAKKQIEAGAIGICATMLGEAEALVAGGIAGVHLTSPIVPKRKIKALAALNLRAERLSVVADHPDNVAALAEAAADAGDKPLTVLVDLDMGRQRTGVPSPEVGLALARIIVETPGLAFGGVQAYAGHVQHVEGYGARITENATPVDGLDGLLALLRSNGLEVPVVTGAGTGSHEIDAQGGRFTELQCGSYIFTDVEYNAVAIREGAPRPFKPSLFVRATVVSANAKGFVTADAGIKRFPMGGAMPEILRGAPEGATYRPHSDEHGTIELPESFMTLPLGATVDCLTPHCDPTVNLYDLYHVVRGDTLVDIWPVDGRGAV